MSYKTVEIGTGGAYLNNETDEIGVGGAYLCYESGGFRGPFLTYETVEVGVDGALPRAMRQIRSVNVCLPEL
jgi:hypothetical protein